MDSFVSFCEQEEKKNKPDPDYANKWKNVFEVFSQKFKTTFELPTFGSKDRKERILGYLIDLLQTNLWPSTIQTLCIRCLKIITRSRKDLGPLYQNQNVEFLLLYLKDIHDDAIKIEALSLVLNLCIIDSKNMLKIFGSIPTMVELKSKTDTETSPTSEEKKKKKAPLFTQVASALTSQKESPEVNFFLLRILWHVTIDKNYARVVISQYDMFPFIFQMLIIETGYNTSGGLPGITSSDAASLTRRGIVSHALQILFNLIMDSSLPSASSKVSMEFFNKFADCCKEILSINIKHEETQPWLNENNWETKMMEIEVPVKNEDDEDDKDDKDDKDDEDDEDDAGELLTATEFLAQQKQKNKKRKEQKMEKKMISKRVMKPHPPIIPTDDEKDPQITSLIDLKFNVSNLMIYMPQRLGEGMVMNGDYRAIHGLAEMLYRQAQERDSKLVANALTPILTSLIRLCKGSKAASRYLKWYIFHDLAQPPKNKKTSNLEMTPEGQKGRKNVDDGTLRYILISYMTSFDVTFKSCISEFLWQLCDSKKYELIRLTGFGNAIGLLASKGLPGFTGLTENAINLDDLVEAKRKQQNKKQKNKQNKQNKQNKCEK